MRINEVLDALDSKNISSAPVVDENGRVYDSYHKSDVSFILRAADNDAVMRNLDNYTIDETLVLRGELLQSGELIS